jgi:hypothetical protein
VDRELLLGLEDETSGELVTYCAYMPLPLLVDGEHQKAVFGSFLTAAPAVRGKGAARAVQVRLFEEAISRSYQLYLAFCEVGAPSNESSIRSSLSLGLTTQTVATISYLALPASAVMKRTRPASGKIRPYEPEDRLGAATLPRRRPPVFLEARHDHQDLDHRFLAAVARTYVLPGADGVAALAHFALLEIRDGGRRFRNAYLRDFEPGGLDLPGRDQFLSDALRALAAEPGTHLVVAPACAGSPVDLLAGLGFRPTHRSLNLLATRLRPGHELPALGSAAEFRLDVF